MPGWLAPTARRRREAGNITIELGLVLPLLLLILGGALDLGMLFWEKQVLTNATREGARVAAMASLENNTTLKAAKTQSQVRQVVQNYLDRYHIKDLSGAPLVLTDSMFSYTWAGSASGTLITVALNQIPYRMMLLPNIQSLFGSPGPGGNSFFLNARTTMAAEWSLASPPSP